jgi:hypothetical protein
MRGRDSDVASPTRLMYLRVAEVRDRVDAPEAASALDAVEVTDFRNLTGALGLPEVRDVSGANDVCNVSAWSWANEPLNTFMSKCRPDPARRPRSVYCQNV